MITSLPAFPLKRAHATYTFPLLWSAVMLILSWNRPATDGVPRSTRVVSA